MRADAVIALVLVAGALYLAYHVGMWAQRAVETGLPL